MRAYQTDLTTAEGLAVYDLDPQAGELWAVAGPAGVDPTTINTDALPEGFRWVADAEWSALQTGLVAERIAGLLGNDGQVFAKGAYTLEGLCIGCGATVTKARSPYNAETGSYDIEEVSPFALNFDRVRYAFPDGSAIVVVEGAEWNIEGAIPFSWAA